MSAVPRIKSTPRTVPQLEADLRAAERSLVEAQRANSAWRTRLPALIAEGDGEAIAECRDEIKLSAARIADLEADVESVAKAVTKAKERDHASFNLQRLRTLEKLMATAVADHCELERTIGLFGAALITAAQSAAAAEAELQRSGIFYDRYLSIATRIKGRAEMCVWLATDGVMGRQPTLDTASQLRASGRASLELAATEFSGVVLRTARLKFADQPN